MRIVAGTAGGVPIFVPKGPDVRPTMDRVRAAIFSSLAELVPGARVLDLFAGTGALGLEALSRGAAEAVLIEKDARAIRTIERNLAATKVSGAKVIESDVFSYLDRLAPPGNFELIFADPPYAKKAGERDFTPELLASASLHAALAPGGIFVLEHLPGAKLPLGTRWECTRQRKYGATEVAFLQVAEGRSEERRLPGGSDV
jgi:16S rRNA (guanine966-N2)-methyltransferase